jgi:outer membrane biosynthesis protein TonB
VIGNGSASHETLGAVTAQARARGVRPIVLAWAVVASMAVHGALMIASLPGGKPGLPQVPAPALRASLVPVAPSPVADTPAPAPIPPLLAPPAEQSPAAVAEHAPPPAPLARIPAARSGVGSVDVMAEPLLDPARLGDLLSRQVAEFRAEIDRPVRLEEKIVVRFPASALSHGREDLVAVWVIVDTFGNPEEVHVTEGSEEFAAEVVAAVRAARFIPAENKLNPIRHPIALQFDFRGRRAAVAQKKR